MSRWRPVWLVARREILTRLRTRSYQLSTAAVVLLVIGGMAAGQWLPDLFDEDPEQRMGVVSAAVPLKDKLREVAAAFGENVVLVDVTPGDDLAKTMEREDLDAILVEPDRLVFEAAVDATLHAIVVQAAFEAALPERATSLGLSVEEARKLIEPVAIRVELAVPEDEDEDDDLWGVGSVATVVLLMAMSLYGQWVLVGVIEEKSNRVVEVLLAVVRPWQLLTGKVLGILGLAIIQIGATLSALAVSLVVFEDVTLPEVAVTAIAMAVLWLVLGLLLYNFMYAAVGATATRPEDASSAMAPVLAPMMMAYFVALIYVPENPDALASRALSLFPLTAPLVMPVRIASGGGSAIEVILAVGGMIAATVGVIWLASHIYTGAILQTQRIGLLAAFRRSRA
ncbi:MAG: ABC transporter permease [Dehalococcoidia bacterium]|nr:ABC transporter permease [Dehalococcoidia bacterium]